MEEDAEDPAEPTHTSDLETETVCVWGGGGAHRSEPPCLWLFVTAAAENSGRVTVLGNPGSRPFCSDFQKVGSSPGDPQVPDVCLCPGPSQALLSQGTPPLDTLFVSPTVKSCPLADFPPQRGVQLPKLDP